MATTITVKSIPEDLYRRLKASAERHRRSINSEVLSLMEQSLMPRRLSADALLDQVQRLHASFDGQTLDPELFEAARREGRP
jgi:plasmid stability protein